YHCAAAACAKTLQRFLRSSTHFPFYTLAYFFFTQVRFAFIAAAFATVHTWYLQWVILSGHWVVYGHVLVPSPAGIYPYRQPGLQYLHLCVLVSRFYCHIQVIPVVRCRV